MNHSTTSFLIAFASLLFSACVFVEESANGTSGGSDGICVHYCDAVMPCDGPVNAPFTDWQDCNDDCQGMTEHISTISNECADAHREFMTCLGLLTCDEALEFNGSLPGKHPICGAEESRVLSCQ